MAEDSLPSWNAGAAKAAIVDFVARVTTAGSPEYVIPEKRIATFDNDGTLWSEQPFYFQGTFAFERLRELAPLHPEWANQDPFKSVLDGDLTSLSSLATAELLEIVMATHSGMTTEDFENMARAWLTRTRHPHTNRLFTEMVFQPMLELLAYLRAHDFKTFIVSGGGIEFMRTFAEITYGIPPEQVIGSSAKLKFEMRADGPVLTKVGEVATIDDTVEKPCEIQNRIGRRPIAAFGNSDGDLQMLQWTTSGPGARFALLVHHTDDAREWAYDRPSPVGQLDKALIEARAKGWTVVDMKHDWRRVFPFQ